MQRTALRCERANATRVGKTYTQRVRTRILSPQGLNVYGRMSAAGVLLGELLIRHHGEAPPRIGGAR